MKFINLTPHTVTLNNGVAFESEGVCRVANSFSDFDSEGICDVQFGEIEGLPKQQEGVTYIVSALVLSAAKAAGRTDCVAPATGHPSCVRENGFIKSVPGFVRQNEHITEFLCVFLGNRIKHACSVKVGQVKPNK